MDQQAKLTSSKSIELAQGESKLKLDGKATLASQHIALEAKTFVEIVSDATCMIDAAITEISGATTRIEGTDVTVADTSGGTIAIAGGIIRLN